MENMLLAEIIENYLQHAPVSLTIREVNRIMAFQAYLKEGGRLHFPVLDAGCGDGFWWKFLKKKEDLVYGIDISASELSYARSRLQAVELCDISASIPFHGKKFETIIGLSLIHI